MKLFPFFALIAILFCSCDANTSTEKKEEKPIPFVEVPRDKTNKALNLIESARTKMEKKDFKGAKNDLDEAIKNDPYLSDAYSTRGELFVIQNEFENALAEYNKVIELSPNKAVAFGDRASILSELKRYDSSINDWTKCIELEPGKVAAQAYAGRGYARMMKEDYKTAI